MSHWVIWFVKLYTEIGSQPGLADLYLQEKSSNSSQKVRSFRFCLTPEKKWEDWEEDLSVGLGRKFSSTFSG